jgi:pimeloyl-ACP methyl ester carboxylesterase
VHALRVKVLLQLLTMAGAVALILFGVGYLRNGGLNNLRGSFDLISWDPRGVGGSEPLDCATDTD